MYALFRYKTTHEVSTLLHKQRWISTRQIILFETCVVIIYATLDTRRKNGVFKQKSQLRDIKFTKTWYEVMLNKEILLQWESKQTKSRKK